MSLSRDRLASDSKQNIESLDKQSASPVTEIQSKIPSLHFVLDLDRTLISRLISTLSTLLPKSSERYDWFEKQNLIARLSLPSTKENELYLFHPGLVEFIKYIFQIPEKFKRKIKLSFFSAGSEERNNIIIKLLFFRVFGEKANDIFEKTSIFSFQHCTGMDGHYRKNLSLAQELDTESEVLLIDDKDYVIIPGQEKNVLLTCGASKEDFTSDHLFEANHIFLIVGLLEITLSNARGESFIKYLQKLKQYMSTHLRGNYYYYGLQALRNINPRLRFYCKNSWDAAIRFNSKEYVDQILKEEKNIDNTIRNFQQTPLMLTIGYQNLGMLYYLLEKKADINARNDNGCSPLMYAMQLSQTSEFLALLERKAKIDLTNSTDVTTLISRVEEKETKILGTLVNHFKKDTELEKINFTDTLQVDPRTSLLQIMYLLFIKMITDKMEAIRSYQEIPEYRYFSEVDLAVIKKIVQMRILTIEYETKSADSKSINEAKIVEFLKSSEPRFFKFKTSSLDVYKKIQQKSGDAEKAYIQKCNQIKGAISTRLR